MFKKLLIGIIFVGVMSLLITEAKAGFPKVGGGIGWGTVDCYSLWRGLGNTDNTPTLINCVILPVRISAQCQNPGGNIGGGVVFNLFSTEVAEDEVVYPYQLDARGRYESELIIPDAEIFVGLNLAASDACDGFNNGTSEWIVAPNGDINVIQMFAAFTARWDVDEDGVFETLVENNQYACKTSDDTNFDEPGLYDCEELCDKTRQFDCPESLTNYYCVNVYDEYPDCEPDGKITYENLIGTYFNF